MAHRAKSSVRSPGRKRAHPLSLWPDQWVASGGCQRDSEERSELRASVGLIGILERERERERGRVRERGRERGGSGEGEREKERKVEMERGEGS